ncbi:WXG100 family type VII secretion target [Tumebacillus sp. ITR2]|uniref:WXG100 family type VII secretion target n=1 Tax=Tumebacillus amylolyticus TaxID=2801339 RepID=A0ABS1JFY4_9BACL|nr:WXG100 family type VII secretion target [Tumebacillus amylolyticus]MBL0389181.1 WXG100 family type VII secretion target [Tumebacillus amylolyticus]
MLQGDPYALRYTASRFGAGAGELRRQASRLVGHQTQLVGYEWSGTAAVSFAGKNEQHVGYLRQQADVLERAASVLTDLAGKIERVQELRRQAEQIQMVSWEYNDDTPDSIHHKQNLAHQAARLRQQADMEASEADSLAAGRFHEIMSGVPDVVVLPDAVWSYYKRHPELVEQAEDDEYGQDRNQLLAAFRQYYTSKQPDYLPDEVRAEAAEQYLKYLYDLSNEQLYDRLQDLLGEDEEAAYYQSLIQDPDFDADKQLDDDEGYQNYIKKQLAQNESPGSVYMAGTAFAVGIMKAMGPKYSADTGATFHGSSFEGTTGGTAQVPSSFATSTKQIDHYEKHGREFDKTDRTGQKVKTYKNAEEYLLGAREVIKNGIKVQYQYKLKDGTLETRTGYVKFMSTSRKGIAKFEFVGTNNQGEITTYHVESGKDFWKLLNGKNENVINPIP